jgi:hypothetical protein
MPATKTAEIWLEMAPLGQLKERFQLPRLFFWDDGAKPYWAFEVEGSRAFIPSSRENAFAEGLLIFWATYFATEKDTNSELFDAFADGVTPISLIEISSYSDQIKASQTKLATFDINFSVQPNSYVVGP